MYDLLRKKERFDSNDLMTLREGLSDATAAFSNPANVAWVNSRLAIESISAMTDLNESIRKLDESSARLALKTNCLTRTILWVTVAAVPLAAAQVVVAVLEFHH